jgi:hypothetical protein
MHNCHTKVQVSHSCLHLLKNIDFIEVEFCGVKKCDY